MFVALPRFAHLERDSLRPSGQGATGKEAGPAAVWTSANERVLFSDALPASGLLERICLERMWRAVGRPPRLERVAEAIGLCACRRAAPLLSSRASPGERHWRAYLCHPGESRGPALCFAFRALDSGVRRNDEAAGKQDPDTRVVVAPAQRRKFSGGGEERRREATYACRRLTACWRLGRRGW